MRFIFFINIKNLVLICFLFFNFMHIKYSEKNIEKLFKAREK